MEKTVDPRVKGVLAGEIRAIARVITLIENQHAQAADLLAQLYPATGKAMTIGVTGPPGAGKSTFVDRLVGEIRASGKKVAVVAVDPASPFTGGAILGDRIRMTGQPGDTGVYIRSMSTRGHLGGIALATEAAVNVLDAAGFEVVIVETVGVGQSEIEVAELADTTLLVQPPGLGDGVQAVKAGIMEVPALFVINKADLPGAKQAANEIRQVLELAEPEPGAWPAPVLLVQATEDRGHGVEKVWEAIQDHWRYLDGQDRLAASRAVRAERVLWKDAERQLVARMRAQVAPELVEQALANIRERKLAPHEAASALVKSFVEADTAPPESPKPKKGLQRLSLAVLGLAVSASLFLAWLTVPGYLAGNFRCLFVADSPDRSHEAQLWATDMIDLNYKLIVDKQTVYVSPDFAPYDTIRRDERLVWSRDTAQVVVEVGGHRLYGYDANERRALTRDELSTVVYAPIPPRDELGFEGEWPLPEAPMKAAMLPR